MNWISVDERLPINSAEDMGEQLHIQHEVIIFDGRSVQAAEFQCGRVGDFWHVFSLVNVTHWMPLPAPPTGDTQ